MSSSRHLKTIAPLPTSVASLFMFFHVPDSCPSPMLPHLHIFLKREVHNTKKKASGLIWSVQGNLGGVLPHTLCYQGAFSGSLLTLLVISNRTPIFQFLCTVIINYIGKVNELNVVYVLPLKFKLAFIIINLPKNGISKVFLMFHKVIQLFQYLSPNTYKQLCLGVLWLQLSFLCVSFKHAIKT